MSLPRTVLSLSCPNRAGIVAAVSGLIFDEGFNILAAHQYDDPESGQFFMRVVFNPAGEECDYEALEGRFASLAQRFSMTWRLRDAANRAKVMIMVSRFDHCLADLLYRWRTGELAMEITAIISNYPRETFVHADIGTIPFHYLPVSKETKMEQEAEVWRLIQETGSELVVLARYMQVLSEALAAKVAGRCINIHHSFLPGFKGAKPYHQAFARGVKLIGATAHYVTPNLDEGPIIEQDVERITHADTPEDMVRKGRDIERRVLARAVTWHVEDRIMLNGRKTVVFPA